VKAAFAFVHYKGQAGVIAHPDLLSDFRYRLVEKWRDGAQDVRGHPDVRLLLSDVDGTLVAQDKVLTEAAKEAARELYDAGIALAITSGRPPRGMSMLIKPLAAGSEIVCLSGLIRDDIPPLSARRCES
jgi:phosphoglycolate phosphatase-like HAD superfamily hydrolase